jgi:hypothetical protein
MPIQSIQRLESASCNPQEGGFLCITSQNQCKKVAWRALQPIEPVLDAAKIYAQTIASQMEAQGQLSEVANTNWPSVVAAICEVIRGFNQNLRLHLYSPTKEQMQ